MKSTNKTNPSQVLSVFAARVAAIKDVIECRISISLADRLARNGQVSPKFITPHGNLVNLIPVNVGGSCCFTAVLLIGCLQNHATSYALCNQIRRRKRKLPDVGRIKWARLKYRTL